MKLLKRRAAWLVASAAILAGIAGAAGAQTSRALTVAVLTFGNTSGYGGSLLGSRAAAATESELIQSGRFDVVKRSLVDRTMSDLNLSTPLGPSGMVQLASALEADDVISGDVLRVTRTSKTNQVRVQLRVEMTDRSSGELVNGAIVTGESGARSDISGAEDVLTDEAMGKAAFAAVRAMNDRLLPEGTIYTTSTRDGQTETLINVGSNSGVRIGMEFIVLRNKEKVGRIRVNSVSPTDATAVVTETTRGVQPEDKVRAVFRLENIPVEQGGTGLPSASVRRQKTDLSSLAMGTLALFGLAKIVSSHGGSSTPGVNGATAVSSGPYNGAPAADVLPMTPNIHVTWRKLNGVASSDILGYFIYRHDQQPAYPVDLGSNGQTNSYDDARARTVTFTTDPASSLDVTDQKVDGMDVGSPSRYRIVGVYVSRISTTDSSGTTTTSSNVTLTDAAFTGLATGIIPPLANSATSTTSGTYTFSIQTVPGADRYVVQVAANADFTGGVIYPDATEGAAFPAPDSPGPLVYWATTDASTPTFVDYDRTQASLTQTITADISRQLANLGNPSQVVWRAGARDTRDAKRPENGGWVWGGWKALNTSATSSAMPMLTTGKGGLLQPVLPPTGNPGTTTGGGRSTSRLDKTAR